MRVLVTGGAGYIGSHAARHLMQHGHEVWIYDNLSRGHRQAAPADRLLQGDLADTAALRGALTSHKIDAVMHFAALTYVGESVRAPDIYYRNNTAGTLALLDAMRASGVKRIVFSSTAAVYGTPDTVPITEDAPLHPINPYGRSKLAVEWMLRDHADAFGIGFAALRYFNAAGASVTGDLGEDHDPETHLIPIVLQAALGVRGPIEIFGNDYPTADGTCIRDYIHVEDLAAAHLAALEHLKEGQGNAYNLGSGRGFSVLEVVRACERVTGREIPVKQSERRAGDPAILVASPAKAMRELGWEPKLSQLEDIISTAWQWHRDHPEGYRSVSK